MLNCKEMTKVISQSLDGKISFSRRMEMWMHVAMCGLCRRFRGNALALSKLVRSIDGTIESSKLEDGNETLSQAAKTRMQSEIDHKLKP